MQSHSNGVILSNGSSPVSNGDVLLLTNGCEGEESELTSALALRKRKQRLLSGMDTDIIRLIGQHLREMGFHQTLDNLMDESGCALEHPKAAKFRSYVIAGEWQLASKSLDDLVSLLEDPSNVDKMRLLLLEEKYLELLECGKEMEALHCLRHELAPLPLHHSDKHIQVLTSYMMYMDKTELQRMADWPGVKGGARERLMDKLQAFLPASVMLPPKRLHQLLTQALQLQVDRCPFHYVEQNLSSFSLLTDHICSRNQFPSEAVHTLTDHSDEVWYLKFSHNGTRLATGSRDGQIIIWNVGIQEARPQKMHMLKGQNDGIASLSWCPDDSLLLSCGREDSPEAIVFSMETGEVKCRVQNSAEDSLTACAWKNCGKGFYVGGTRGQFLECSIDGAVTASWEGIRVQALATHPSTNFVYAADTHRRIRRYNFQEKTSSTLVQEDHPILSFTLSRNGRHALLNVQNQGVHVWDLQDRCLVRRYQGVTQGMYTIHSTYGGINDSFIASGSEDHHVYVWQHRRETPVIVLKGHSRPVNCVAWNPIHHDLLASVSDDGTVRVWGTQEQLRLHREYQREQEEREKMAEEEANRTEETRETSVGAAAGSGEERRGSRQPLEIEGEGEGMDVQHSEASLTSETEPQSSELERVGGSSSSLSSGQLEESISFASERTQRLVEEQSERPSQSQAEASAIESVVELLQTPLESSVDPEDRPHSLDSSNGSTRPPDSSSDIEDLVESSRTSVAAAASTEQGEHLEEGTSDTRYSPSQQQQQQQQQEQQRDSQSSRHPQTTGGSISTVV